MVPVMIAGMSWICKPEKSETSGADPPELAVVVVVPSPCPRPRRPPPPLPAALVSAFKHAMPMSTMTAV
eukprot:5583668-Prymnesium_polylepis.1